MISEIY